MPSNMPNNVNLQQYCSFCKINTSNVHFFGSNVHFFDIHLIPTSFMSNYYFFIQFSTKKMKTAKISFEVEEMKTILCILLGYLLGSLPFALIIGKVFYHTDIRQYGSGNLGGTNAGRVLGKKAGISVIVFDVLKVVLAIAIATQVSKVAGIWTGLACCIGHCYPIFAKFHGGKAVSTMFGFLFSTSIFLFQDASYLLVPFGMFIIILYLFKYVSLASMCAAISSSLYITALMLGFNVESISVTIASWLMTVLVIYRHRTNIEKIKKGTENTISWL